MDIDLSGLVDRRVAAADEYRTRDRRAIHLRDVRRDASDNVLPVPTRRSYDVRTAIPEHQRRDPGSITRVILHQMGLRSRNPLPPGPSPIGDDHRLDVIIAHLMVRQDGTIIYAHDIQLVLNGTAALRDSIEIEFEGTYNQAPSRRGSAPHPWGPRLSRAAIEAGRRLLRTLYEMSHYPCGRGPLRILSIRSIHPHQQYSPVTRPNCPGPDIWVNVGQWAIRNLAWHTYAGRSTRQISDYMTHQAYNQDAPVIQPMSAPPLEWETAIDEASE